MVIRNVSRRWSIAVTFALALTFSACEKAAPTAPDAALARASASSESARGTVETIYTGTLVSVTPSGQRVLPDGTVISELEFYWKVTGDWDGDFLGTVRSTTHMQGGVTDQAWYTFQGAIFGMEGSLDIRFQATFQADGSFKGARHDRRRVGRVGQRPRADHG